MFLCRNASFSVVNIQKNPNTRIGVNLEQGNACVKVQGLTQTHRELFEVGDVLHSINGVRMLSARTASDVIFKQRNLSIVVQRIEMMQKVEPIF